MRHLMICLFALALCNRCYSQVIQVGGGQSTIQQAAGGGATIFLPGSTDYLGVGVIQGQVHFSASSSFNRWGSDWILGDATFGFSAGGGSVYTPSRGVFMKRKMAHRKITTFLGAAGQSYSAPFFNAYSSQHIGAGILFEQELPRNFSSATAAVIVGGQKTAFESVGWHNGSSTLLASGAGGIMQNTKLTNGTISWHPITFLALGAMQSTYMFESQQSAVTSGNVGFFYRGLTLSSGLYHSSAYTGQTAGANLRVWRLEFQSDYANSERGSFVNSSVGEKINSHLTLRQYIQGNHVTYGGRWQSNPLAVDVAYQTEFFPLATRGSSPFARVLTVTLRLQLRHSITANVSTITNAGKTIYAAYGDTYANIPNTGPMSTIGSLGTPVGVGPVVQATTHTGKYLVRGTVTNDKGQAVEGAVVQVDGQTVISNGEGKFQARFGKQKTMKVQVKTKDFVTPGDGWQVVSCPATATTGDDISIVVRRN